MQFNERKPKVNRFEKLMVAKKRLEESYGDLIQEWARFDVLSDVEKSYREKQWGAYYQAIKVLPPYKLFQTQRDLLKTLETAQGEDLTEVLAMLKGNSREARLMLSRGGYNTLPKPPYTDPYVFKHSDIIQNYQQVLKGLQGEQSFENDIKSYLA